MYTHFDAISDPMSFAQYCKDEADWTAHTSVQKTVAYRDKWADKQIIWTAELSDVAQSGDNIEFTLKCRVGYTGHEDPDSDNTYTLDKAFWVSIPISSAGNYLNFNKGDSVTVSGVVSGERGYFPKSDFLLECTVEINRPPPPASKKKSSWW